jgi:hypothetical protein
MKKSKKVVISGKELGHLGNLKFKEVAPELGPRYWLKG